MITRSLCLTAVALTVAGCAVGPDFRRPGPPTATRYTETELPAQTVSAPGPHGQSQSFDAKAPLPAKWWTVFHSDALDDLIARALVKSPTVAAAQAALRQAAAQADAVRGSLLFPSVSANAQAVREREAIVLAPVPGNTQAIYFNVYNASVSVSYSPDVFGSARRQIEAATSQALYQALELQASQQTLVANVVTTAVKEASLRSQIRATQQILGDQTEQLRVIKAQLDAGAIPRATLLSQQTQYAQTQATIAPLQKALAQTRDQLAYLIGETPGEANLPTIELDTLTLPDALPVSLPSELVRQRPDIRASEALLHYASAEVGVATAALYPQIQLSGQYGTEALKASKLFQNPFTFWSLAAGITEPIFNGGALSARRRAAIDAFDVAAAQYRQTVLGAFQNVADALNALALDAQSQAVYAEADRLASEQLDLVNRQYHLGAISVLTLLDAQRQAQQARINLVQAEAARLADTAALYEALGAGAFEDTAKLAHAD